MIHQAPHLFPVVLLEHVARHVYSRPVCEELQEAYAEGIDVARLAELPASKDCCKERGGSEETRPYQVN